MARNKRIYFTPIESTHDLIEDLASLTGKSKAAIVSELLYAMEISIKDMVAAFKHTKESKEKAVKTFAKAVAAAHDHIDKAQLEFEAMAEKVDRRTVEGRTKAMIDDSVRP